MASSPMPSGVLKPQVVVLKGCAVPFLSKVCGRDDVRPGQWLGAGPLFSSQSISIATTPGVVERMSKDSLHHHHNNLPRASKFFHYFPRQPIPLINTSPQPHSYTYPIQNVS